ncbi:nuclear transport factor 2 family protein [Hydrogenophaga sp. 2FB]|uniref:YybH family protein n=1 Tax=Hydrogenophaga sp. 2FB TaxID=2502187 RepID=UPI0010F9CF33|nr:nuclear transport factor 2 family protein [Hydrogenophaga sp. 2FB]
MRADFRGLPEQNHPMLCERLRRALADPGETMTLGLRIKEIIVSGSMAVVRLTWTATVKGTDGKPRTEDEQGLDVFARQADGAWKIVRYMAYPE